MATQIKYNCAGTDLQFAEERNVQLPLSLADENRAVAFVNQLLGFYEIESGNDLSQEEVSNLQCLFYHYENLNHYYAYTGGKHIPGLGNDHPLD